MARTRLVDQHHLKTLNATDVVLVAETEGVQATTPIRFNETEGELRDEIAIRKDSNIYMLCTRDVVSFVPGSFVITQDSAQPDRTFFGGLLNITGKGGVTVQKAFAVDGDEIARYFVGKPEVNGGNKVLKCRPIAVRVLQFPHQQMQLDVDFLTSQGQKKSTFTLNPQGLTRFLLWRIPELQNLEVAYVGMSVGSMYARNSRDRLSEGHKARRTLANEREATNDFETLAVYLNFRPYISSWTAKRQQHVAMPNAQVVSIIEACLINRLKPRLNHDHVNKIEKKVPGFITQLGVKGVFAAIDGSFESTSYHTSTFAPTGFQINSLHEFDYRGKGTEVSEKVYVSEDKSSTGRRQLLAAAESESIRRWERLIDANTNKASIIEQSLFARIRSAVRSRTNTADIQVDDPRPRL